MSAHSVATGILLSGHSSTGKTTLARALQDVLPDPWVIFSAETVCLGYPRHRRAFVTLDLDHRLREACVRSASGFVDVGLNVILEQGVWDPWAAAMVRRVLGRVRFFVIGVTCDLEVAEAREVARLDRNFGVARQQRREIASSPLQMDLIVDSTDRSPVELADRIAHWLATEPIPSALRT